MDSQRHVGKRGHQDAFIGMQPNAVPCKRQRFTAPATIHSPRNAPSQDTNSWRSRRPIRACRRQTNYRLLNQYGVSYRQQCPSMIGAEAVSEHAVPVMSHSPYDFGPNSSSTSSSTSSSASVMYSSGSSQSSNGTTFSPRVEQHHQHNHNHSGSATNIVLQNTNPTPRAPIRSVHSSQHLRPQIVSGTLGTNAPNYHPMSSGPVVVPTLTASAGCSAQHVSAIPIQHPMSQPVATISSIPSIQAAQTMIAPFPSSMMSTTTGYGHSHFNNLSNGNVNVNLNHTINLNHNVTHNIELNASCFNNPIAAQPVSFAQFAVNLNPMTLSSAVSAHQSHQSGTLSNTNSAERQRIQRQQQTQGLFQYLPHGLPSNCNTSAPTVHGSNMRTNANPGVHPTMTMASSRGINGVHDISSGFKTESHPTKCGTRIISLLSDDEADDSMKGSLYRCDSRGYIHCTPGLVLSGKYRMIRQLGKGTFSRVFECQRVDGAEGAAPQKYAVKVIRNVFKYQLAARTELEILRLIRQCDPDGTSCCIHIVENDQFCGHPIFVFPLLSRSIYSFMLCNEYRPFNYDDTIDLLWQICRGAAYIHSLQIVITDLKPENIVLVNDEVDRDRPSAHLYSSPRSTEIKLIDFGSAVVHRPGQKHSHLIQTRHYRAPEVVFKLEWDFSADVWSIGCILVELICGKMLFNTHCSIDHINQMVLCSGPPPREMLQNIDDGTWSTYFSDEGNLKMENAKVSPVQCSKLEAYFPNREHDPKCAHLFDLCTKMLCWDPAQRITADQALQHPVFQYRSR